MKIIAILTLTLTVAFSFSAAYAKVFKCDVNGQTKYQASPCPENSGGEIEVKPNVTSTEGIRRYIEEDKIPKMLRDQAEIDATRAKRAWMGGQVKAHAEARNEINRIKVLKYRASAKPDEKMTDFERHIINYRAHDAQHELDRRVLNGESH